MGCAHKIILYKDNKVMCKDMSRLSSKIVLVKNHLDLGSYTTNPYMFESVWPAKCFKMSIKSQPFLCVWQAKKKTQKLYLGEANPLTYSLLVCINK